MNKRAKTLTRVKGGSPGAVPSSQKPDKPVSVEQHRQTRDVLDGRGQPHSAERDTPYWLRD